MDSETPICNGSQGIVEDFTQLGTPIVKFRNGSRRAINYHTWQSEKIPIVGIKQIPLILAWAVTIHKSQGATLEMAEIDIGNHIFACGQTYVALSRVKNLDGLYLKSFNPQKIKINLKVVDFYNNI
jgi:ATP-dependent DNA helicase PIF1